LPFAAVELKAFPPGSMSAIGKTGHSDLSDVC